MGMEKIKKRKNDKTKIVLVFGTFDALHKGHIDFFRQARKHGGFLTAIVARDKTVLQVKKRKPIQDEKIRLRNVKKHVDKALLGSAGNKYALLKKIKPDIVCLGYDQDSFTKRLRSELKNHRINSKIFRLRPYKPRVYKSKILRRGL